jgi:hypothetical protein
MDKVEQTLEQWKVEELKDQSEHEQNALVELETRHTKERLDIIKGYAMLKKIIQETNLKYEHCWVSGSSVYINSEDFHLAHNISKILKVELKRGVDGSGANYKTTIDGIHFDIYGMTSIPHCKLVKETITETVTRDVYKLDCSGEVVPKTEDVQADEKA